MTYRCRATQFHPGKKPKIAVKVCVAIGKLSSAWAIYV